MATVTRDISLSVTAEVQRYAAEIGKLPGMTEAAAAKAAIAMGKELAKAEQIALKTAGAVQESTRGFGDMRQALGALSPAVGGLAADFEDLLGFLGPAGAAVGVGAAVGAVGVGFVRMTESAADASQELERVGLITRSTGENLRSAAGTIDAARTAWQAMSAAIAEKVGGALQGLIRWTMIASMAWDDFISGRGLAGVEAYVGRVLELEGAVKSLGVTAQDVSESGIPAFERMAASQMAIAEAEAAWMVAQVEGTAQLDARIEALQFVASEEQFLAEQRIALMQAEGASAEELGNVLGEQYAAEVRRELELLELTKQVEAAKRAERQKSVDAWVGAIGMLLNSAQQWASDSIAVSKVLAAVEIALNSAVAGWRVFAEGGLKALPLAALVWGAGGVSAAWAMTQAFKPPSQHPTPTGGSRADRREARRQAREDRRDGTASAGTTVEVTYRHRHYDDATRDALRRDSPLRRETRGSGQRSR